MTAADATTTLAPLVQDWLPNQRFFMGKGRDSRVTLEVLEELSDDVTNWLVNVDYDNGEKEVYQLPLAIRSEPKENLEHALVGSVNDAGQLRWVYDALHDKDVTGLWLSSIRDEKSDGRMTFRRHAEPEAIPVGETSLVLSGEQSNTSLVYGDTAILKVFRMLRHGVNPDIEIGEALGQLGSRNTPRLLGTVTAGDYALAMLQEFMTTAADGWRLATTSVRDLMAEADLHPEEAGGDFAGEAFRLGTSIAQMHADLAEAIPTSETVDIPARSQAMHAALEAALAVVAELAPLAPGLHALFDRFGSLDAKLPMQRIHGDLHLGQVLRTSHRWVVIDFEGEPMAPLEQRRRPDSPLRDIAGMLRSFDYAGYHRIIELAPNPQLAYRAAEWATRNRDAFCDGYTEGAGFDPRDQEVALRAYEADKAVYEAVYEARNRPDWLPIPVETLARLTEGIA